MSTGTNLNHISATGHRPIPLADTTTTLRASHTPWCTSCKKKVDLNPDGLCTRCARAAATRAAGEARRAAQAATPSSTTPTGDTYLEFDAADVAAKFTAATRPTQTPAKSRVRRSAFNVDEAMTRYAAGETADHLAADYNTTRANIYGHASRRGIRAGENKPTTPPTPQAAAQAPTTPVPTGVDQPPTPAIPVTDNAPRPAVTPHIRAKITRTSPHDVIITLRSTTEPIDPVAVAALLSNLLHQARPTQTPAPAIPPTSLAGAGPHVTEPRQDGSATPGGGDVDQGKATSPSAGRRPRKPARREHNGPRRMVLPEQDIVTAYQNGQTLAQIAADHGCSHPTIARVLDDHGVVRRKQKITYTPELIEAVRTRYEDQGMTQAQAADDLGVTLKIVQTAMIRGNIDRRESASELSMQGIGRVQKIPHEDYPTIIARYQGGESAPSIAKTYDCAHVSIYSILAANGVTERHGHKTLAGPGQDRSAHIRDRIRATGATANEIKRWGLHQGLVERITRGIPNAALIDAYIAAHPTEGATTA